jgi:hypothetical protein
MFARKAVVGLALLCALLFSAVAAQSASAIKGTTAFTCAPQKEKAPFKDAHCKEAVVSSPGFKHDAIAQDLTTFFHATNNKTKNNTTEHTPAILKGKIAGIAVTISCTKVFAHGTLTNKLEVEPPNEKEHYVHGHLTVHYTECKVTGPAGCKIPGETIEVPKATVTTTGKGDNVTFAPTEGNEFVSFKFEGCTVPELNTEYKVLGSVTAQSDGATLNFNEAAITKANELTFGGQAAGLEGSITVSQADATEESAKTGNAITLTTVET